MSSTSFSSFVAEGMQSLWLHATVRLRTSEAPFLRERPLFEKLALLSVVFMPFQFALTLKVGFPLKISEVLLVAAMVAFVFSSNRRPLKWDALGILAAVIAGCVVISGLVNLEPHADVASEFGYQGGLQFDLILYTGYALFALLTWSLLRLLDRDVLARAVVASLWACGAAVVFQFLVGFSGRLDLHALLGFRTIGPGGNLGNLRSGPFLEGQHLGFFAGAALLVALYRKSYIAVLVAIGCVAYSRSTTAYLGLIVGILVLIVLRPTRRVLITVAGVAAIGTLAFLFVAPLRDAIGRQLAKLGLMQFAPDAFATTSLDIRSTKAQISLHMMLDNFWLGVGPGRFGAHFANYSDGYVLPGSYQRGDTRPIAENAYTHIGAELGIFAVIAFIAFVLVLIFRNRRVSFMMIMLGGYLALAVATQSSWTFLPIWTFFALLATDVRRRETPATVDALMPGAPRETEAVSDDAGANPATP